MINNEEIIKKLFYDYANVINSFEFYRKDNGAHEQYQKLAWDTLDKMKSMASFAEDYLGIKVTIETNSVPTSPYAGKFKSITFDFTTFFPEIY